MGRQRHPYDTIDLELLLCVDKRFTIREMAERVYKSTTTVAWRLKLLKEDKLIAAPPTRKSRSLVVTPEGRKFFEENLGQT